MARFFMVHSRAISVLTCCSMGLLAYAYYADTHWSFRQLLEAVIKRDGNPSFIIPAQPDLENLSTDVLLEIMALLEWDDILRLRQVSTRLNVATRHRTIWYNLLKPSPARFTLQKRFENCSSEDLETSFLQVQLAHRRWVKPSVPRRVELLSDQDLEQPMALLPGGRWILMLNKDHELLYLRADTPAAPWSSLVPPSMGDDVLNRARNVTSLTSLIDMGVDAEYLTFNIIIPSLYNPGGKQAFLPTRFIIWRVTTDFDVNGCATGLKATQLSVFEESRVRLKWNHIHLSGDFVTYHDDFPVVVNWKMANGCTDTLPRYCIHTLCHDISWLYILPKNQVLYGGVSYEEWFIEGWDNLSPTTTIPRWNELRRPWSHPMDHASITASGEYDPMTYLTISDPPFINGDCVFFISHMPVDNRRRALFRISFKLPEPSRPAAFLVKEELLYTQDSTSWAPYNYAFTPTCGLLLSDDTFTTTTNHVSHNGSSSAFDMFSWPGVFPSNLEPTFAFKIDEISRRCIFTCPSTGEAYIVEF